MFLYAAPSDVYYFRKRQYSDRPILHLRKGVFLLQKYKLLFFRAPSAAAAVILSAVIALCSVTQYYVNCAEVRENILRLHVIAASDSEADQTVKLLVRDAVLREGAALCVGADTADEAIRCLSPYLARLERAADRVLRENGFPYRAKAGLTYEYFDVRSYNSVTLPAGNYHALKIVLGSGEGKNWWCVMFPPLCLPAVTEDNDAYAVFNGDGAKVVYDEPGYEVRFKIVELIEKAAKKLRSRSGR